MTNSFFSVPSFEMTQFKPKLDFQLTKVSPTFNDIEKYFITIQKIGKGSYGHVYKVRCKKTNQIKALKLIKCVPGNGISMSIYLDVCMPNLLNHSNIIHIDDIKFIKKKNYSYVGVVMECSQINIYDYIAFNSLSGFSKTNVELMYNMAKTVVRSTLTGVLHSDIKGSNFVVNTKSEGEVIPSSVRLIDFGLAQKSEDNTKLFKRMYTCGYRSPEMLFPTTKHYSEKAEVWALGCVFYLILFDIHPFYRGWGKEEGRSICSIISCRGHPKTEFPEILQTNEWKKFYNDWGSIEATWIRKSLDPDNFRINSLLEGMLELDPDKRLSIQEVLNHPIFEDFFKEDDLTLVPMKWIPPKGILSGNKRKNRDILLDWIVLVCFELNLSPDIIFSALEMIDRILVDTCANDIDNSNLQMLSSAVLIIQSSLRNEPIRSKVMKEYCADEYTIEEIDLFTLATLDAIRDKFLLPTMYDVLKYRKTNIKYSNFYDLILLISVYSNENVNIKPSDLSVYKESMQLIAELFFTEDTTLVMKKLTPDTTSYIQKILSYMEQTAGDSSFQESINILLKTFTQLSLTTVVKIIQYKMEL